jgi:hypothetical protein
MQSMSFDPAAANIGPQLVEDAVRGIQAGTTAAPSLTTLVPAGADEVSLRAAMAFATEAAQLLALSQAAHEELMRTGEAFTQIAQLYSQTDAAAANLIRATPLAGYRLAG